LPDDSSGTKVILDTIFYNSHKPDSIKLKDGTVIYMKHLVDDSNFKHHQGKNHVMVTASSDEKADGKEFKEVTVVSSDSLQSKMADDSNNVMYYSNSGSHEGRGGRKYKVMIRKSNGQTEKDELFTLTKVGILRKKLKILLMYSFPKMRVIQLLRKADMLLPGMEWL